MKFEDIHGTDWRFTSPDGEERVFPVSGYGKTEKPEAERFEREHPNWKKTIEEF